MDSVGRIECRLSWKMVIQSRFFKPKECGSGEMARGGGVSVFTTQALGSEFGTQQL